MILAKWHRKIFLIDFIGAATSAFFLGMVLPMLKTGVPDQILRNLAWAAVAFAVYSYICHYTNQSKSTTALKIILYANVSYVVGSIAVVFYYFEDISSLGLAYFVIEVFLIILVIWAEKYILQDLTAN